MNFKFPLPPFFLCIFVSNLIITLSFLFSSEPTSKKKICLNMIVKDEKPVIERSLNSVKPFIDYWVIVDTGSTDGTQDIIKRCLKDIPGELHERPWVDFAHNRNEALNLARDKSDYLLFIDADETLTIPQGFQRPSLIFDCYTAYVQQASHSCQRVLLITNTLNWRWVGVLHEELTSSIDVKSALFSDIFINAKAADGHRSQDPMKLYKDAQLLEKALEKDPNNGRYLNLLGQTYVHANEYEKAINTFEKRVAVGGWDQEVFWSLYSIGLMQQALKMSDEIVMDSFSKAFHFRQSRVEPLHHMIKIALKQKNYTLAYVISKLAITIPVSLDTVYVEHMTYEFRVPYLYAIAASKMGQNQETVSVFKQLLDKPNLPNDMRRKIEKNLGLMTSKSVLLKP